MRRPRGLPQGRIESARDKYFVTSTREPFRGPHRYTPLPSQLHVLSTGTVAAEAQLTVGRDTRTLTDREVVIQILAEGPCPSDTGF